MVSSDLNAWQQRIQVLEDIEAIKCLKARYLNSCDLKNVEAIRACFSSLEVLIDYGQVGVFHQREGLIEAFNAQGNHPYIADSHHASNPEITIVNPEKAIGRWALAFHQINSQEQSMLRLDGVYDDEYVKEEGAWVIAKTRFTVLKSHMVDISEGVSKTLFAGSP